MTSPNTQPPDLDTIEAAITVYQHHPDLGFACCSAHLIADAGAALVAEVRRLRADDLRAEIEKLIRWHREDETSMKKMRGAIERLRAEKQELGELAARRESELISFRAQLAAAHTKALATPLPPRRTLTESEYSAAWHAVEGAAGEEGADPGTVLHAVLDRLGINLPAARPAGAANEDSTVRP